MPFESPATETSPAAPAVAQSPKHRKDRPGRPRWLAPTLSRLGIDPAASQIAVPDERAEALDRKVSLLEVLAIAAIMVLGIMGLVSLAAAHLHHNTPAVIFPIWAAAVVVVTAIVVVFDRPSVRVDRFGLVVGTLSSALTAFMVFPGFKYGTGDKDPGVYIGIAAEIQRYHSLPFPDPMMSLSLPDVARPFTVIQGWPGLWPDPRQVGMIFPQFYHLWPALLVASKDVGGWTGMFDTGPVLGVIAVAAAVAIGRRVAGITGAVVAGAILATNMLQVWQTKYPSSEIYGQLLFVGALLGAVVAVRTGWRSAAAMSGFLLGLGYLERADEIVPILIAWAMLCVLLAVRRFDWRAGWLAIGIVVLLPYGFYQAYYLARTYTLNNVPSLRDILAIMIILAVIAGVVAWQGGLSRWLSRWLFGQARDGTRTFWLGAAFVALCGVGMVVGFLRVKIFGKSYVRDSAGQIIHSYDEITLVRLSWFFSLIGFALLGAGIVWIACRRWRVEAWIVAVVTLSLFGLYAWHTHNAPYLMWDFRRFVTSVVPGIAVLIGCGVAWCVVVLRRWLPQGVVYLGVVAITTYFGVFGLSESLPLRHHDEAGGSVSVVEKITALAGKGNTGVFLWSDTGTCCDQPELLFGSPMMSLMGQESALAPSKPSQLSGLLDYYATRPDLSTHPVFYVNDGAPEAISVRGVKLTAVRQFVGVLQEWEETYTSRPDKDANYHFDFTVYRVEPALT